MTFLLDKLKNRFTTMGMSYDVAYPSLYELKTRAKKRLPHFVWEYLNSGTGQEHTTQGNRYALDKIKFMPSVLHGEQTVDLTTTILNRTYDLPFGVAPVGMSGLVWANAEALLARNAVAKNIPYTLSTVACQDPEALAPHIGQNGWFQLYPPRDPDVRKDMLKRIKAAGFHTLVLTVDLPVASRRERQTRSGITQPPVLTARLLAQIMMRPAWAIAMARQGRPSMPFVASYGNAQKGLPPTEHIGYLLRTSPDWDYVKWLRDHWDGSLIIKGVLDCEPLGKLEEIGIDAVWVSNHAGRQFDAAPSSIDVLPDIRQATKLPLIADSGFETGLDIIRAYALGADFVMMAAPWHYALAALGRNGPDHLTRILELDLKANLGQLGCRDVKSTKSRLI